MDSLRKFSLTIAGLFFGYVVGFLLTLLLDAFLPPMHELSRVGLTLSCAFAGAFFLHQWTPKEKSTGKFMSIKIQRQGKEPNQGVGYLDDGTMVVVNGGGDSVGEDLRVRVLSVKQSSAGQIIFCNLIDEGKRCELQRASTS